MEHAVTILIGMSDEELQQCFEYRKCLTKCTAIQGDHFEGDRKGQHVSN